MYPVTADVVLVLTLTVVIDMPKSSEWNSEWMGVDGRCMAGVVVIQRRIYH